MNLKLELNKSDHSDLVHIFRCEGATERDLNTTVLASQVIASISSALFYLAIFFLSILGVCFKSCIKVSSSQGTFFVFLVGALISFVNVFTNEHDLQIKLYCRIFTVFLIGIVFTLFGALLFFKRPGNQPTLGRTQPSMGLVVALITFPLIGIEIALLMAARTASSEKTDEPTGPFTYQPWTFVMADKSLFLVQKIIQALIYLYLRNTTICQEYKENAQFYFRTLSFFNLIEWVDTQVNVDNDIRLSGLADQRIVIDLYKPLIIDYRLLCSLLFLEHSVDIQTEDNQVEVEVEIEANNGVAGNTEGPYNNMTPCDRQMRCIGYVAGCVCLIAPLFCGLYYVNEFQLKPWVNAFAIVVNLAIVACGTCLLWSNDLDEGGNKESHGVKIMVCCLGAVGFTCWMIKAAIACYWAATVNHRSDIHNPSYGIRWEAAKFAVRCVTTAFLMGLFMKINARAFSLRNATTKINHLLVPAIMLGIVSVFAESLIDQYVGELDKILSCEVKEQSLDILFKAGPPMYLGFLIHVCLHFVIILTSIGKSALAQCQNPGSSNSSYRSARSSIATISDYLGAEADLVVSSRGCNLL